MSINARLLFFLVLAVYPLRPPAFAQDASAMKQSTAARATSVASLIANRVLREDHSGFLVIVASQPGDQARQIMSDENRDRVAIFKLIAAQTGETAEQVAALYAQRAMKLNPPDVNTGSKPPPPPPPPPIESCNDLQLAAALKDRFAKDEDLKPYSIQVDVTNKTIILSGLVSSDLERTRAAEIVRSSGCPVTSLVNDLTIGTSDNTLAALIKKAYASDPDLHSQSVKVEVSHGNVVLSGSVSENIVRTVAAYKASQIHGVTSVTNNIVVVPVSRPEKRPGNGEATPAQSTAPHQANLSGSWIGTYTSCAQGQSSAQANVSDSAPDDITATVEIEVPNAAPGTFITHGVLNTMNNFLSFQFSGWQHQPPGLIMGNIGGYVTFTDQGPVSFTGIIKSPGCGQISLRRR